MERELSNAPTTLRIEPSRGQWRVELPRFLRNPSQPPLRFCVSLEGNALDVEFDAEPVLTALLEGLILGVKDYYDVEVKPWNAQVKQAVALRVTEMNPGKKGSLLSMGKRALMEVEGEVLNENRPTRSFMFEKKSMPKAFKKPKGMIEVLSSDAHVLAEKVAEFVLQQYGRI
jgi:hypothetical protein